jgi:catechol 2,3-dioxygenase-like lactoylglutathione lyase family enzyme
VRGVAEIALFTDDLVAATKFYRGLLGVAPVAEWPGGAPVGVPARSGRSACGAGRGVELADPLGRAGKSSAAVLELHSKVSARKVNENFARAMSRRGHCHGARA